MNDESGISCHDGFALPDLNAVEDNVYSFGCEEACNLAPAGAFDLPDLECAALDQPTAVNLNVLEDDLAEPNDPETWQPGQDVGRFVARRWRPLIGQSQVLVCNAVLNLAKLPKNLLNTLLQHLPACKHNVKSKVMIAASSLLRLPASTVQGCFRKVKSNRWQPTAAREHTGTPVPDACPEPPSPVTAGSVIMQRLVREALHTCAAGHADQDFLRTICRLQLANVDMGSKYHSTEFLALVEYVAGVALQVCDAHELSQPMRSHGMKSMLSAGFDIGNLGRSMFSKHEILGNSWSQVTKASLLAGVCFPLGMYWGQSFWRRSDLSHRNMPFKWFNHLILTPPPAGSTPGGYMVQCRK